MGNNKIVRDGAGQLADKAKREKYERLMRNRAAKDVEELKQKVQRLEDRLNQIEGLPQVQKAFEITLREADKAKREEYKRQMRQKKKNAFRTRFQL